jgi:hypothetical protein
MLDARPQDLGSLDRTKLECGQHAFMYRHGELYADACRRCERACAGLLASLN